MERKQLSKQGDNYTYFVWTQGNIENLSFICNRNMTKQETYWYSVQKGSITGEEGVGRFMDGILRYFKRLYLTIRKFAFAIVKRT